MRIRDNQTNKIFPLIKVRKPKMTEHRGRTWDQDAIELNGEKVYVWRDFTWGSFNYFAIDGQWYKFTIDATDWKGKEGFSILG